MVMPDPARTVSKSLAMLRRAGVHDYDALLIIVRCCQAARLSVAKTGHRITPWLDRIEREALTRLVSGGPARTRRHPKVRQDATTARP